MKNNYNTKEVPTEISKFVTELVSVTPSGFVFNPYNQNCDENDNANSARIRVDNFSLFLTAQLRRQADSLWIGESVGYNGSRGSGLYLYGEESFKELAEMVGVDEFRIATKTKLPSARTVSVVWDAVKSIPDIPVTFNIFPFHSYQEGNEFTNRKPLKSEIEQYLYLTSELIDIFKFSKILAIGRLAEQYLHMLRIKCSYVRHPSMGGVNTFHKQIADIYIKS